MTEQQLLFLAPFVLFADLLFLLWREVVLDVERLPDLFRSLSLDHVSHSFAGNIQQTFNVQIVGRLNINSQ